MTFPVPVLRGVKWSGVLLGAGSVEMSGASIVLHKENDGVAIWRNFALIPQGFQ
jgi:hypothetical protein